MIASAVIVAGAATIYAIREDKCIESPYITVNCQPKEDTSENSSSSAIAEEGSTIKDSDAEEVSNSTQQSDSVNIPDSNQQAQPIAIGSGYEDLKEDEAKKIVEAWLEAKPKVYGPDHDIEVAKAHINYPGIVAIENTLKQFAKNKNDEYSPYYWKYDRPSVIDSVHSFEYLQSEGEAELIITVVEYKSFYTKGDAKDGGRRSQSKSGEFRRKTKYTFGYNSDGTWKIADIECQEFCDKTE